MRLQQLCQFGGESTTSRINDGAALRHTLEDMQHFLGFVFRLAHHIDEVLALKTHGDDILLLEPQLFLYVIHNLRCGSSGESKNGNGVGDEVAQFCNLLIGRTEIVAPLRNAMGFIHTNHADVAHSFQFGAKQVASNSFWRNIEKAVVAQDAIIENTHHIIAHHARVDGFCLDATQTQLRHLVLHQRDEGSDNKAQSLHRQCWHLETDGFSSARRHQSEGVAPFANAGDDLFLNATKGVVAPIFSEYVEIMCGHSLWFLLVRERCSYIIRLAVLGAHVYSFARMSSMMSWSSPLR